MKEKSKHYYECDRNKPIETTPCYYIGLDGMKAIDVIHEFDLSYDLGNAVSYILRCKRKHDDQGVECITKAIEHLKYELKKIKKNKGRGCCNLK